MQCGPTRHEIRPSDIGDTTLVERHLIVHPTTFETDDERDHQPRIQAIFSDLAADEVRTRQICRDVHDAVADKRTCLVLTQRTERIDAIVEQLTQLGTHAHVLRGGLGKQARESATQAIAENDGSGIVVVATGSYIGEGFDWPELDTLFLAFPIAFKGRVVQYVGRLLRTHGHADHNE